MGEEAVAGLIGFGVFFTMWVVLPTILKRKHKDGEAEQE
jgi:hypothetical protein